MGAGKAIQTWRKENVLDWMCWGFYRAEAGDGWGLVRSGSWREFGWAACVEDVSL